MKKLLAILLAAILVATALCACLAVSAEGTDARFETFDLTALDETAPVTDDGGIPWYADGIVVAITNNGSAEKTITSADYALRYLYILVFDGNGTCVEIGNNLFSADDPRAGEFPQHDVVIPAGGFVVLFYYNPDNTTNQALYDYYDALGGATVYNSTIKVKSTYSAEIEKNSVVIYFGEKPAAPETSSAAPSEEPSKDASEEASKAPSEESSKAPAEESSKAPSAATSSTAPATSSSSTSKVPTGDAGIIGLAVLAVVAIAGVAVAVKVRH